MKARVHRAHRSCDAALVPRADSEQEKGPRNLRLGWEWAQVPCVAKYSASFATHPSSLPLHIELFSCSISVGGGGSGEYLHLVDCLCLDTASAQSEAKSTTISLVLYGTPCFTNEKLELQIKSGLLHSASNRSFFSASLPFHFQKLYYLFMTQSSRNNMHLTWTCNCYPINYSVKSHRSAWMSPKSLLKSWQRGAALDKFINQGLVFRSSKSNSLSF